MIYFRGGGGGATENEKCRVVSKSMAYGKTEVDGNYFGASMHGDTVSKQDGGYEGISGYGKI